MNKIKFIQVNIYKGKYFVSLLKFLKKENPDIISMQEVTLGEVNLCKDKSAVLFDKLKRELGMSGVFANLIEYKDLKNGLLGNAIFTKYPIGYHQVITLKTFRPVTYDEVDGLKAFEIRPKLARNLLDATLSIAGKKVHAICWHGAWTAPPTDTRETIRQAKIVADYIRNLDEPFILGGDLNNTIDSKTVGLINKVANNFMFKVDVKMTTHPKVHKIAPRGFLVDYIFASKHFTLKSIEVAQVLVSDHLPVVAVLEL